jgi:hypothetical protein
VGGLRVRRAKAVKPAVALKLLAPNICGPTDIIGKRAAHYGEKTREGAYLNAIGPEKGRRNLKPNKLLRLNFNKLKTRRFSR